MTVPTRILLITGMSGAGKSTALKTLEDIGWEAVDNLPLSLLDRMLTAQGETSGNTPPRPLAIGIDSRTRAFDSEAIVEKLQRLRDHEGMDISILFLDCTGAELERRFSETRRRHPLALDRPAADGIARERELLSPLRHAASHVIDTTDSTINDLRLGIRARFGDESSASRPTLTIMSFGFARGMPRNADLVFDMRFLNNPHWQDDLRPLTGLDPAVGAFISNDPAYSEAIERIEGLVQFLLPRYSAEGKTYVTVAVGCTGGRHRSVYCAEQIAKNLRGYGFSPTVVHRDMGAHPDNMVEGQYPRLTSGAKEI